MKKEFSFIVLVFLVQFVINGVEGADANNTTQSDYPDLRPEWPYCFEFTWFGPDFDNVTKYNGTCTDYLDETRADGVPCASPIVISYDGTLPNMNYLWDKYKTSILCKRSINQRCIKYTYFFNNYIANITYMCAKVQHNKGGMIDSGCYKQKLTEGYETEVCVCKSSNGIYPPCNNAEVMAKNLNVLLFCLVAWMVKINI